MLKRIIFILLVVLVCNKIFAQESNYVEYSLVQGTIDENDQYKKEFGRYDGFQVPLNAGEYVYFSVFSEDFNPSILLVSPTQEKFSENQSKGTGFASIKTRVPTSGEWYVYVIGTANSKGSYYYQYAFADSVAVTLPEKKDFCSELNFLIKHASAYFLFLQDEEGIYKISNTVDAFIDGNDGSYNSVLFNTGNKEDAERKFIEYNLNLKECLGGSWQEFKGEWKKIEDFKQKKTEFMKKIDSNRYSVLLKLNDFSSGGEGDFSLELVIINTK